MIGFVRTTVFGHCPIIGIVVAIDVWYFLTIGIVRINDVEVSIN